MNINFVVSHYDAGNLIGFVALTLVYLAYRKSVYSEFKSWVDLLKSFRAELHYASSWIGNAYSHSQANPTWTNPSKIVFPLSFESAKALLQKGHPPRRIVSRDFLNKLAIFNERVKAFNHLLWGQLANYVINASNKKSTGKKTNFLNRVIHAQLIGSIRDDTSLYSLYNYFIKEIKVTLNMWESKIPWYLRQSFLVISLGFLAYLFIDFLM